MASRHAGSLEELSREQRELLDAVAEVVLHPGLWMDTPHDQLGGRPPRELMATEEGIAILRGLVEALKAGHVT